MPPTEARAMTHGGRQARTAEGWRPGQGDPFPAPQAGSQAHASPRFSAKFHLGPPGGAQGRWRGRGRGTPEGPSGVYPVPRGGRLRSEGGTEGIGIRIQGRRALGEAGFWGLHSQGFGVESSQTPGRLGCRHPRPSPLSPFLPSASSRAGAPPGLRLGQVSRSWPCGAPGRGKDT